MESPASHPEGWTNSARRIAGSVLALARTRFELFTVEWQEEKLRLLHLAVWFMVGAAIGMGGVLVALAALAIWLWTVAGYLGLVLLAAVALATAAGIFVKLRAVLRESPTPFGATTAEFRKDAECLKTDS